MSEIVEKTLESLQNILGFDKDGSWSVGFRELVEAVANGRTKPQLDDVLKKEATWLRRQLSKAQLKPAQVRECLSRALYCELLGHEVPFTYIHAVKLAQQGSLLEKRAGYLAATMFLHPNHELSYLIIGTVQKDLKSSNPVEVCLGLGAIPRLIGPDTAPALVGHVIERCTNGEDFVRKKALLALQHLMSQMLDKTAGVSLVLPTLQTCLSDPDFGVVSAALAFLCHLVQEDAFPIGHLGELVKPLCDVLRQIVHHKVPSDLVHQGVAAPWTQILLLRILAKVGKQHGVADVLQEVLEHVGVNCNMAAAVLCECVNTALELEVIGAETLVKVVAPLLQTVDPNIKYMGVKTLGPLLTCASKCAISDELRPSVIEGLYSADESVRSGTLNLLFQLADAANVEVICAKMLEFIESDNCESDVTRVKVGGQILKLAHQFRPDVHWYLRTALAVVKASPDAFCPEAFTRLLSSLREGSRSMGKDVKYGIYAVNVTLKALEESTTKNSLLLKLALHTVGDFWEQDCDLNSHELWQLITSMAEAHVHDRHIMSSVLLATRKILIRHGASEDPDAVAKLVALCSVSEFPELRQAVGEIQNFASAAETRVDLCLETFGAQRSNYDWTLTFLDDVVVEALQHGASPYDNTKSLVNVGHVGNSTKSTLQFGPYEGPVLKSADEDSLPASICKTKITDESAVFLESNDVSLNLVGVKKVWTMQGRVESSGEVVAVESSTQMENPGKECEILVKDERLELIDALFGSSHID